MKNQQKNKLCFLCDKIISDNDRIVINSITHSGYKFNVIQRLKNFLSNTLIISKEDYDLINIHSSCEAKVENELNKTCGDYQS